MTGKGNRLSCILWFMSFIIGVCVGLFGLDTYFSVGVYVVAIIVDGGRMLKQNNGIIWSFEFAILLYNICFACMVTYFFKIANGDSYYTCTITQSWTNGSSGGESSTTTMIRLMPFTGFITSAVAIGIHVIFHFITLLLLIAISSKHVTCAPLQHCCCPNKSCFCCIFLFKFVPILTISIATWAFYDFMSFTDECSNDIYIWGILWYLVTSINIIALIFIIVKCCSVSEMTISNSYSYNYNYNQQLNISQLHCAEQDNHRQSQSESNVNACNQDDESKSGTKASISMSNESKLILFDMAKSKVNSTVEEFNHRCLIKYNMNTQTFLVTINATVTTISTLIIFFATYDDCVYTTTNSKGQTKIHLRESCAIRITSICIGITILIVVFLSNFIQRCKCYKKVKAKLSVKCSTFDLITSSFSDQNFRLIIVLKFAFFIVKPALISITKEKNEMVDLAINLTFTALTFLSVSVLAFATYNKKYKLLSLINLEIIHFGVKITNPHGFAKLHIYGYIFTVIQTYSISIIILIFLLASNNQMNKTFEWALVIYPPAGWLLFMKLYLNEVSQIIKALNVTQNINANKNKHRVEMVPRASMMSSSDLPGLSANLIERSENDVTDVRNCNDTDVGDSETTRQVFLHLRRLFFVQLTVVVCGLGSWIAYVWFIVARISVVTGDGQTYQFPNGWNFIWVWQLFMSLSMFIIMLKSMYHSSIASAAMNGN